MAYIYILKSTFLKFSTLYFILCVVAVTWQSKDCRFTLHYDNGFTLIDMNPETNHSNPKAAVLWNYPYEKLRMSADDGNKLLWLDFGEDGEQV